MTDHERYLKYKKSGFCVKCLKRKPTAGRVRCVECRKRDVKTMNNRRRYRRLLGICGICYRRALPGKYRCSQCLKKNSEQQARSKEKLRRERGWKLARIYY